MKRFFAFVPLILLLAFSVFAFGCSDKGNDTQQTSGNAEEQTTLPSEEGEVTTTLESSENTTEKAPENNPIEYPDKNKELNILFLGNSLMYYNDMPIMFEGLTKADGRKVHVESITKGSATMNDFATPTTEVGGKLKTLLEQKPNWDYFVIEPSRRMSPSEETVINAEIAACLKLQEMAAAAGGKVVLYSVWGNNTGSAGVYQASASSPSYSKITDISISRKAHTKFMHEANLRVAEALGGVQVAEAGYAFENLYASVNSINLYHSDLRHPSAAGSYLAACTIFATIFGEKTEGNTYVAALSTAETLQKMADKTALENLAPDLTETETPPPANGDFNLLVIGSNLLDDYAMLDVLKGIMAEMDGKTLNYTLLRDSTFVINKLVDENNDMGMRSTLASKEWDAIIIQFSRRCTASGTDVEASELNALKTIYPLLKAETDNIYLMTLNSKANPDIFKTGSLGYDKKGTKESMTAEEGTNYYKSVVESWASELGCKTILYGNAYIDYFKNDSTSDAKLGYLEAVCLYNALFGRSVPENCTVLNGLSEGVAAALRLAADKYCLPKEQ